MLVCHSGGPGFSPSPYFGDLAGLGADFTLVVLHPRGTGDSDRPDDPRRYRVEDYVADVETLRAHLGLDRITLLGHSHGGMVAMAYAGAHPGRVERLVLSNTAARLGEEQQAAMHAGIEARSGEPWYADAQAALTSEQAGEFASDEEMADLGRRELPLYFARYDDRAAAYVDSVMGDPFNGDTLRVFNQEMFGTDDLRPELARITSPTLVITGDADFICGPVCVPDLVEGIAGARSVIVAGCGHFIFVEDPVRFRAEVRDFLLG